MLTKKIHRPTGFRQLTPLEVDSVNGGSDGGGHQIIVIGSVVGGTYMGGGSGGGGATDGPTLTEYEEAPTDPGAGTPPDPNDLGIRIGDAEVAGKLNGKNLEVDVSASPSQFTAGVSFDLSKFPKVENISLGWGGLDFKFKPDFTSASATYSETQGNWTIKAEFTSTINPQTNTQENKVLFTLKFTG